MRMLTILLLLAIEQENQVPMNRGDNTRTVVEEAKSMQESANPVWWVSSGAYYFRTRGYAHTFEGSLEETNRWRVLYERNNPRDTDQGYHPQNIFRLVNRGRYENFVQEMYFQITALHLSESENRNESNGVLLFNRYQDSDNLYYTGLRVDGHPVIKKKVAGIYHTLAYPGQLYPGKYDRGEAPNLLPIGKWIGIRSALQSNADSSVTILLYVDTEADGNWQLAAEALDKGEAFGPAFGAGFAGIRTDFMDVRFRGYKATESPALE